MECWQSATVGSGVTDVCREAKEALLAVFYEDITSQSLQHSVRTMPSTV